MIKKRDVRMAQESMKRTMKEMFQANDRNRQGIERSIGGETGYPVVSSFPTGVSDGFVVYNIYSRKLHMYDGTTWLSMRDVSDYIATLLALPLVLAVWSMNVVDSIGSVWDMSSRGKNVTNSNVSFALLNNRVTYASFNGSTSYLNRTDEADLDITGTLVFGCWIKLGATGSQVIISKFGAVGQYAYELAYIAGTGFRFQLSNNGTTLFTATSNDPSPGTTAWYHVACRFTPSTEVSVFVNGVKTANTTSIPASIFASTAPLAIGRRTDGTFYTTGSIAMVFLVAGGGVNDAMMTSLYEEGIPLFT